jgi:OFA family oxalate/formate antiporter-like MFS transporter
MIAPSGYEQTFMFFGLIQGGSVFLLAFLLRAPKAGQLPKAMPPRPAVTLAE